MARADHAIIQRLMFVLILLMLGTGFVKSWAIRKDPNQYSHKSARRFARELQTYETVSGFPDLSRLGKISRLPKDGWGNPFFWQAGQNLLSSAGADELFGTADDLHFVVLSRYCSPKILSWLRPALSQSGVVLVPDDKFPADLTFDAQKQIITDGENSCAVPQVSDIYTITNILVYHDDS